MTVNNIDELIKQEEFYHFFQPLYNINTEQVVGYEALFRSSLFSNPQEAFQAAKKNNQLYELELKNIKKAIYTLVHSEVMTDKIKLFLNIFPSTIMQPDFLEILDKIILEAKLRKEQIILELNECDVVVDMKSFQSNVLECKKRGYFIAIDDFGQGTASMRALVDLTPQIVKIDKYFVEQISTNESKQEMLKSFVNYCESMNTYLIQEGVENVKELNIIKRLGILFGQGYYLGRPKPLKVDCD
ncbi:EAL domain-containing protein [Oceanobacillus sp. Castelsardo]|uniref:EAL domain-containing protein n=1 Tax=Oceanobacillus sp. Castelsardo TaxID=1851204 RepID=UPI000838CCF4|nr:EAL domain-containing protein [Oceanobacillus sp. Castelsardo]